MSGSSYTFSQPWGVAISPSSDIYISEWNSHRILKCNASFQCVALGIQGSGDGQFNYPEGLAIDQFGSLYVADTGNHRVQKFDSSGVFVAKSSLGLFSQPTSLAYYGGSVYVCDISKVQKLSQNLTSPITIGNPGIDYIKPSAVAIDENNNQWILDKTNHKIVKIGPNNSVASYGSEGNTYGKFQNPEGITIDKFGNIFVVDSANNRIQVFDPSTVFPVVVATTTTTTTNPAPTSRSFLNKGDTLTAGQALVPASNSCNCHASMQGDGNFVIYKGSTALWNTATQNNPGAYFVFQGDSNLVIYNGTTPKWNSITYNQNALRLIMQGDCNLVLYRQDNSVVWNSRTVQPNCQ